MTTKRTIVIVAAAVGLTLAIGAVGAVSAFKPQVALYAAAIASEGGHFGGRHRGARHGRGLGRGRGLAGGDELVADRVDRVAAGAERAGEVGPGRGLLRREVDEAVDEGDQLVDPFVVIVAANLVEAAAAPGARCRPPKCPPSPAMAAA